MNINDLHSAADEVRRIERMKRIEFVAQTLRESARSRSKDGMTGISEYRALGLAIDVVDALARYDATR